MSFEFQLLKPPEIKPKTALDRSLAIIQCFLGENPVLTRTKIPFAIAVVKKFIIQKVITLKFFFPYLVSCISRC